MSTNIADAFVIGTIDATELAHLVDQFRQKIKPLRLKQHAKLLAERTCFAIDRAISLGREWPDNPLSSIFDEIDSAGKKSDQTGMRAVFEDFGMSITFIPDKQTQWTYGLLHSENRSWKRMWMAQKAIRPFDYQNSTDKPSHISRVEWDRRESTWDRIMPTGIPSYHGFTATIAETRISWPHKNPLRFQPTLTERRRKIAEEAYVDQWVKDAGKGEDSDILSLVSQALRSMRSNEGQQKLISIETNIRLPRRITFDMARSKTQPEISQLDLV